MICPRKNMLCAKYISKNKSHRDTETQRCADRRFGGRPAMQAATHARIVPGCEPADDLVGSHPGTMRVCAPLCGARRIVRALWPRLFRGVPAAFSVSPWLI